MTPHADLSQLHALRRKPSIDWMTWSLLVVVLAMAWVFRSMNLYGWDGASNLHPDERFIVYTAYNLRVPRSFGDYLRSSCVRDGLLPAPLKTQNLGEPIPLERQEPSTDSGCNTLNPRNYNWSRMFVYGTLPTSLARVVAEARDRMAGRDGSTVTPIEIRDVGRTLSAVFDMSSVLLVFLIGRRLYGKRAGVLAALLLGMAALPIQLAHFFTVDAATAFFTLFSIYWAVRAAQGGGLGTFVMLGVAIGAAMACRITMATLGLAGMLAVAVQVWGDRVRGDRALAPGWWIPPLPQLARNVALLALAGVISLVSFRLLAPDSFVGTSLLDIRPEPRFLANIQQVSGFVSGQIDAPFSQQWANRTPFVFPLRNMVLWGMGVPLGLAAWLSWLAAGWQLVRRRVLEHLIPWTWIGFYFAWQGGQFGMTMRYYALLYGLLAVLAAWGLLALRERTYAGWPPWLAQRWRRVGPALATALVLIVAAGSVLWAYAFTAIYRQPHSRITASRWIYANIPAGATISGEEWDDPLPLSIDGRNPNQYRFIKMQPYAEDDLSKYVGYLSPQGELVPGLLDQLDQLDYIILTSNRVYDSATRLPMRYPALTRYYHTLFNGQLGFELVADIHSYPTLLGVEIPDQRAEEAFSVYDHPRVLIFRKTSAYSHQQAEQLIIGDVAFGELYKLPTVKVRQVPTALRLTDAEWPFYRVAGTFAALFDPASLANRLPWLVWLLVLEALAWAAFVVFRRPLQALPDAGFACSKILGVLAVAYVTWMLASVQAGMRVALVPFGPLSVRLFTVAFVGGAALLGWHDRAALRAVWRAKRRALTVGQALFLGAFVAFSIVRALNPDLWHPARGGEKPMDLAFLTAVLKSPAFPPYDPWFAGGYINYYYFGFVLVAVLTHITGIVPTTAYNLAVASMFALTVAGAWGVSYNLVAAWRPRGDQDARMAGRTREGRAITSGVLAAVLVAVAGNLAQALWLLPGTANPFDPAPAQAALYLPGSYAAQQAAKGRSEWAYWDATRITGYALQDGLINEFPFFTFLFADLHAHMMALPLALAVLGLMLALYRALALGGTARAPAISTWTTLALGTLLALAIGALRATNTWDYPLYLGLSLATIGMAVWVRLGKPELRPAIPRFLGLAAGLALLLVIGNTLLFLPFHQHFATDYAGLTLWGGARTPTPEFLKIHGVWIFALGSAAAVVGRRAGLGRFAVLLGGLLLAALALGTALLGMSALLLALGLVVIAIVVLFELGTRIVTAGLEYDTTGAGALTVLAALWALAAAGTALLPELVVAKGDIGRMNTLFKFGMQSWVLGGVLAGIAVPWVWSALQRTTIVAALAWKTLAVLLIAAALVYPLMATPARLADRYNSSIRPTLDGMAYMRSGTFQEDSAALAWMQATITGTPIVLEAHDEAYRWNGRVSAYTGLPTLLGWPWHETQQRSVANAGPVLQNRQMLIRDLYSDTDQAAKLRMLQLYGIEYVYVGQLERALYAPEGLAALERMAGAGLIDEVYRQGDTRIYHVPAANGAPAVTSTTIPVQTPSLVTERQPAMLAGRVGDLPVSNTYGQFGLGSAAEQILAVLAWLLVWSVLGVIGLPVALLVFGRVGRWQNGGWAWARPIGLLIAGYCVWLPVSAQLWIYDRGALAIGALLALGLACCATLLLGRRSPLGTHTPFVHPETLRAGLRIIGRQLGANRRQVLWSELVWCGAFAAMLVLRALNPDLWQPYWGGEKPFEFGLLNALVRSPVIPPYSPFFSDGIINYYYYGFFLMSMPLKATGIAPSIGFNLIIPTLYAMFAAGLFALASRISGRAWVGVAAVVLVAMLGNLAAVFPAGWSAGIRPVLAALAAGVPHIGAALGSWFVGPSRVIPNTINEFPYWGFLFADLHPHLIALPLGVLALALTFELLSNWNTSRHTRSVALALAALVLGTLAVTNSWDLPTYACVLLAGLTGAAWRSHGPIGQRLRRVASAGVLAIATAGCGLFLFLPFFRSFVPPVGGFGLVTTPTALSDYLLIYGVYLACVVPAVLGAALRLVGLPARREPVRPARALGIVASSPDAARLPQAYVFVLAVLVGLAVVAAVVQGVTAALVPASGLVAALARVQVLIGPRVWAPLLIAISLPLVLSRRIGNATWFAVMLAMVAWLVSFVIEVVYLRDHLATGDWYRMNTVFKFGLQVWVLLALAAALLLPAIVRWLRRAPALLAVPAGAMLVVLVALGLVFPVVGTASRVSYRFPVSPPPTLDGLAFMDSAAYTVSPAYLGLTEAQMNPVALALRDDGAAIRWLNEHVQGTPVVLQSSAEFYRLYGVRVAANTGLPTVVSPLHESEQRNPALVAARDADVQRIYRTLDAREALSLLAKYQVEYVYVGPIERLLYGTDGVAKFDIMTQPDLVGLTALNVVYRNAQVVIYQVRPEIYRLPELAAQPQQPLPAAPAPAPVRQRSLAELEQLAAANPADASAAWNLAQAYAAQGLYQDAANAMGRVAGQRPNDVAIQQFYGDLLDLAGRVEEAEIAYSQAAAVNPTPGNYVKLAAALVRWNKLDQAADVYRQAADLAPDLAEPQCGLALIAEQQADLVRARDLYTRCRDLARPGTEARRLADEGLARIGR